VRCLRVDLDGSILGRGDALLPGCDREVSLLLAAHRAGVCEAVVTTLAETGRR
jgi:hypothetical protein